MGRRRDELLGEWEAGNGSVAEWVWCEDEGVWAAKRRDLLGWLANGGR